VLEINRNHASAFSFARALDPAFARDRTLELDRTLTRALTFARGCDPAFAHAYPFALYTFYACDHALAFEPELKHDTKRSPLGESLQQLQAQLPDVDDEEEKLKQWWQNNGQAWAEKLRSVMIEHRNIGHNWQFNYQQQQALEQYNNANQLLIDCLNSDCYVSRKARQEIEDTLLLPTSEIEKRKLFF
jgi:predicted NACHT family NTPase